jgi:hypothetical protein
MDSWTVTDNADIGSSETEYTRRSEVEVGTLKSEVTANGRASAVVPQQELWRTGEHEYEHE